MSKFHLNKVIREANKAKKSMVNRIKHNIVYGKVYTEIEIEVALNMLANIGGPSFRHKYEWIEAQRRQGLRIA